MIIDRIRLAYYPNKAIDFYINHTAGDNGYELKGIDGFDPSPLIKYTEAFDNYGDPIYDMRAEKKLLSLRVGLKPGSAGTYSSLRSELYTLISRRIIVYLVNKDGIVLATMNGVMDNFDAVHSTNQPDVQFTIEGDEGTFVAPTETVVDVVGLGKSPAIINYTAGDAPTGFYAKVTLTANMSSFGFYPEVGVPEVPGFPRQGKILFTFPFLSGDVLELDTRANIKTFKLTRGVTTVDLAPIISNGSYWPKLQSGLNHIRSENSNYTWNEFKYYARFWGV